MAYLLDANVFINAKRLHYGFDFCPAYWDWLIMAHSTGRVFSIVGVRDELLVGRDELSDWVRNQGKAVFRPLSARPSSSLQVVSSWVSGQNYTGTAIRDFMRVADYFLVGEALSGKHMVVTHEVPANSPHKIKIPDVCNGLSIKCLTPFEMLRREQARFVLGAAA